MASKAEQRFGWIEASLRFAGRFAVAEKKAYRDRFGLTDGMMSRDQDAFCRAYNDRCGAVVVVKRRGRLVLAGDALPPDLVFGVPQMARWLEDALGPRFEAVAPIRRSEPAPAVLQAVVRAITARRRLRLDYRPRSGGEGKRIASPHAIVDIVGRLHLRAWDHGRSAPRDFVLSRILAASVLEDPQGYVGIEHDLDWASQVTLEVLPREGEDVAALRPDYGLDEFGRALRRVRKAYMRYLLDEEEFSSNSEFRSPVIVRVWGVHPSRESPAREGVSGTLCIGSRPVSR